MFHRRALRGLTQPFVTAGGGSVTFALDFTDHKEDTVDAISTSQTGVAIGAADANRIVAVAVWWRPAASTDVVSSMTIGGVSATQVSGAKIVGQPGGGFPCIADVWYAAVPSGTTATVVINFSGTFSRLSFGAYRIITATPTPSAVQTAENSGSSILTLSALAIPSGGGAISCFGHRAPGTANDVTWSSAVKDYSVIQLEANSTISSAKVTGTGSVVVSAQIASAAALSSCLVAVAWDT